MKKVPEAQLFTFLYSLFWSLNIYVYAVLTVIVILRIFTRKHNALSVLKFIFQIFLKNEIMHCYCSILKEYM